jgi:DNA-binding response OmpR family regulator
MKNKYKKLIIAVDDDPDAIEMLNMNLKGEGFSVRGAKDADELYKLLEKEKPDLIILDLMLPHINGFEICKDLKSKERYSSIPIIILSGKSQEADKVLGLDRGSDDYLVKPCSIDELKARIRAVLRRFGAADETKIIRIADKLIIDLNKYEVFADNSKIELTTTEFKILELLASRKGQVFTRQQMLDFLWGDEKLVVNRTIDVHIRHLREKLKKYGDLIKNIRGVGYKIEEDDAPSS